MDLTELAGEAEAAGLACRGGFHPGPEDGLPGFADGSAVATVVLLGFVGAQQWTRFATSAEFADGRSDALDRWSRRQIDALAARHAAMAFYPSEGPPWWPFQRWAMRAEPVFPSPIGVLIHPRFGLWHAYRGALALRTRLALPAREPVAHPCESCAAKPCLATCPVGAVRVNGYDHRGCATHVAAPAGRDCLEFGCLARRSCPVGREYRYAPAQARFHMAAFIGERRDRNAGS